MITCEDSDFCLVEFFETCEPCPICGCLDLYHFSGDDLSIEECVQCGAAFEEQTLLDD